MISVFSVKELPEEELNDGKAAGTDEKYSPDRCRESFFIYQ